MHRSKRTSPRPLLEEGTGEIKGNLAVTKDLAFPDGNVNAPVYAYIDAIGVWHKRSLSAQRLRWLSGESQPLIAPPFLVRRPARFDPSYVEYTRLTRPSKACLEWLADLDDVKMTYGEFARDHIYDDEDQANSVGRLFSSSLVQLRHGNKRTRLFVEGENGNTGIRGPGLSFCWYTTEPSKITGEWPCFHFEARLCGSRALRRYGIHHPRDLLTLNHDEFWQEMWCKRLTFVVDFDRARFGRYFDNCAKGTKRRTSTHEDFRVGCLLYRIYGQAGEGGFSVQGVWDRFGRASYINGDLRVIHSHHPELIAVPELGYPLKKAPKRTNPRPYRCTHPRPYNGPYPHPRHRDECTQ